MGTSSSAHQLDAIANPLLLLSLLEKQRARERERK